MTYFLLFYFEIIVFIGNIVIREFIDIFWACSSNNQRERGKFIVKKTMEHWLNYFMQMLYITFKQLVTLNGIWRTSNQLELEP